MKNTFVLILTCFLGISSQHCFAQAICGFDSARIWRMRNDPQYQKNVLDAEASVRAYIKQHPQPQTRSPKTITGTNPSHSLSISYTIPVVVHVIHTGGAIGSIYNPSDAQIQQAIDYLNAVYNGTWPGTVTSGLGAGDLGIQFVLAKRDPNCNPTNGINRVDGSGVSNYASNGIKSTPASPTGANEVSVKNLSRWSTTQYYNVWIVNKIDGNDGTHGQFIAGYAYIPPVSSSVDGIVMLATQMVSGQKTLPHEIGHAFGLYHPFNGSNDNTQCPANTDCSMDGDQVCDTDPIRYNYNSSTGLVDFTCLSGTNPCTSTAYTDATESNYMNYTNCYTLFTPGQAAKMQGTAAGASRSSLTTSLGGTAPGAACGPKINFEMAGDWLTETSTGTTGCRSYTDYTYNMVIGTAPSVAATATLSVTGGTAVQGVDYDLTTNGNFSSPSQQLTFPTGTSSSRSFTIRIYDDASVNGTRTFTLGFTVNNGGGNAVAGTGRATFTMTIYDNDQAPSGPTNITYSIGTDQGALESPFRAAQAKHKSQFLYYASELTSQGIKAGNLLGLSLDIDKFSGAAFVYHGMTIKIGQTTQNSLYNSSTEFPLSDAGFTTVYSSDYTTTNGWNSFTFSNPFTWNGTSNLVIEICYDNGTTTGSTDNCEAYVDVTGNVNYIIAPATPCGTGISGFSYYTGAKPMIQLVYADPGTSVQTILNASRSEYLGPNTDVYFYDQSNGQLMARIQNLSSFDYGCTQVVIDRAGTGATQFWNNNPVNYLMNKTFHVIPTTNNSSGSYNITLYYTQAEVSGWQSATTQNLSAIQLVKVPGQISTVTPASPNGAGTVTIVTPSISSLGSNTGLTYGFNNGFSGFGAGVPDVATLPIGLLRFDGRLDNNNALLTWATSSEDGNKGFEIDRSFDGIHFSRIGFVTSAGNSKTEHSYSFVDPSLTRDTNYYRLKQIDLDDRFTYSKVVLIRDPHVNPSFTVLPNPFTDQLDIVFGQVQTGKIQVRLLDATGRELIHISGTQSTGSRLHMPLPGLSAGVYLLEVRSDNDTQLRQVLKK